MKKIFLFLLAALLIGAAQQLKAQDGGRMQQRMEMEKKYLKDSLNLSDALVDSVTAIRTQFQPQMREIYMDQSMSRDDKQAKIQTVRQQMEARYKAAGVTDEQLQKMREHEMRMRAGMRNRG